MYFMYLTIFCIAIFGGQFIKFTFLNIPIIYIILFFLFLSYFKYFIFNKDKIYIDKLTKILLLFELYGIFMVCLSLLGINQIYISHSLFLDLRYIPRQSFYLLILPAIILMKDEIYINKLKYLLSKYNAFLFLIIYLSHMLINQTFALSVPTIFILAFLHLYNNNFKLTIKNVVFFMCITFTPIATGGELTNLIIRVIYLFIFIFKNKKEKYLLILNFSLVIFILTLYSLPFFAPFIEKIFDANSAWRLRYWYDEVVQFFNSYLLGVGYGTSYATENFVGNLDYIISGPFAPTLEYSTIEKLFVVGPHNSFITILFRLGIIGCLLLLSLILSISNNLKNKYYNISWQTIFMFYSSIVIIGVNVGLESPFYLLLFTISLGFSFYDLNYSY